MHTERTIVVYSGSKTQLALPFDVANETVWATQLQIQELFGIDQSGVSRHVRKIFSDAEVDAKSNMQKVHIAGSDKPVTMYSLDVILAVGYRTHSSQAIEFRRWANEVLKRYIVEGAALNEQRLAQLGQVVQVLARSSDEMIAGVAEVLANYLPGLVLLRDYDEARLAPEPLVVPEWTLTLDEARGVIAKVAREFPDDALLGKERGDGLAGVVATIYQGFGGTDLYPTVEEKAANLLYLVVKDHPLSDGNKRSAAALFVTFLARNGMLRGSDGRVRVANNALAAITLMVAMSDPKEKDLMIALIIRMLTEENA